MKIYVRISMIQIHVNVHVLAWSRCVNNVLTNFKPDSKEEILCFSAPLKEDEEIDASVLI